MNRIAYIANNKIYVFGDGKSTEIPCGRIEQYKKAVSDIRKRNEWKTTGTGAKFMGTAVPEDMEERVFAEIGGIAVYGDKLVYGVRLDESGSICIRSFDPSDRNEGLVISGKDIFPKRMDCAGNKLAVSLMSPDGGAHISVFDLDTSKGRDYTDGDSTEEYPVYGGGDRIYFSTAGFARNDMGQIAAVQNKSVSCLDTKALSMDEVLSDERYDYICPFPDGEGGFYCIRQPAGGTDTDSGNVLMDIVMFPYRIIKAAGGFLNAFSMTFGGEALKSGGTSKAKQKDERQAFIEGNLVNAEKNMKNEERSGEQYPGIMPAERVLVHIDAGGGENILRRGVLDFLPLSDGNIAVSNGRFILITDSGGKELSAFKADKAVSLKEIK